MKGDDIKVRSAPRGAKQKLRWLGPGITWLAAGAGGAGELLFPPRVGSLYGYAFLWALIIAILLKWFINKEIGRYAVCTGRSLLDGFKSLPGPANWAVWLIVVPQIFVAVGSIAGIAGAAATAFILLLPGSVEIWTGITLISAVFLLSSGSYRVVERVAMVLAIILGLVGIVTAVSVFPPLEKLAAGLRPIIPEGTNYIEIIPWLSFLLAGAAGMTWYSYWLPARGYGAADTGDVAEAWKSEVNIAELKGWKREMVIDNTLGVIGGFMIVVAFLILGTELLRPEGIVPEENRVASVLGKLLESTWGRIGFWGMIVGVLVGFWNTAMTNQDGWTRLFLNAFQILSAGTKFRERLGDDKRIRLWILWGLLCVAPFTVFVAAGEPVGLLQVAGVIEAIHIPIIAGLTLYMNSSTLPGALKPSLSTIIINVVACSFFLGFAALYLAQLFSK